VLGGEREESNVPRAFDCDGEHALVSRARSDLAARLDLCAVGQITAQLVGLLEINVLYLVLAKGADTRRADAEATSTAAALLVSITISATAAWRRLAVSI
jgi:hypothetical protein